MMETATRFERKDLKEPPDTCMMEETGRLIKFLYNETMKLWQKKPAMEQSQGISVDLESSVLSGKCGRDI